MTTSHTFTKTIILIVSITLIFALFAKPTLSQDEPGPQLCNLEDPLLTPLEEYPIERVDDLTAIVFYTNRAGQEFEIWITSEGMLDDPADALDRYLNEAQLCAEIAPPTDELRNATPLDIAFGDIFLNTFLEIEGYNLESLAEDIVARRENDAEEIPFAEYLSSVSTEEFLDMVLEMANAEIDDAIGRGLISKEDAEAVRETVRQMYIEGVEEPDASIIITESMVTDVITVDIMPAGDVDEDQVLYVVVDPTIYKYKWRRYRSSSWDGTTYAYVCTNGRVKVYLWTTSNYWWSRTATSTYCPYSTYWIQGPWLYLYGKDSVSKYTVNSGWSLK